MQIEHLFLQKNAILIAEANPMITITITEFRKHFGKYLAQSQNERIIVTRRGKPLSMLKNPYKKEEDMAFEEFMKLRGCLPADLDYKALLDERDMSR